MSMDANVPIPRTDVKTATQTVTDSATFVADTHLSFTLRRATRYRFVLDYTFTTVNSSGVKVDLNGGTATMTSLEGVGYMSDLATPAGVGSLVGTTRLTALTTAIALTACGTLVRVHMEGALLVNAGGTFIPRFAQNAETGAAESVIAAAHSTLVVQEIA